MDVDRGLFSPSVGELVRFRSWEDMEREFGCNGFRNTMISEADGEIFGHGTGWCISEDMIEYAEDLPYDSSEIDMFLSSMTVKRG